MIRTLLEFTEEERRKMAQLRAEKEKRMRGIGSAGEEGGHEAEQRRQMFRAAERHQGSGDSAFIEPKHLQPMTKARQYSQAPSQEPQIRPEIDELGNKIYKGLSSVYGSVNKDRIKKRLSKMTRDELYKVTSYAKQAINVSGRVTDRDSLAYLRSMIEGRIKKGLSLKEYKHISQSLKDLVQNYVKQNGYGIGKMEIYEEIVANYPEVERHYDTKQIMQWIDAVPIQENSGLEYARRAMENGAPVNVPRGSGQLTKGKIMAIQGNDIWVQFSADGGDLAQTMRIGKKRLTPEAFMAANKL